MWALCFAQAEVVSVYLAARLAAAWRHATIQKCESVKCWELCVSREGPAFSVFFGEV